MRYDVAIVGAGITGQAHAYAFLKRGKTVALIDSRASLAGQNLASLGLIRPAAQPPALYPLALKSRKIWLAVIEAAGLWHKPCGSLLLVQTPEELRVIEEFTVRAAGQDVVTSIIDPVRAAEICKPMQSDNLYGALWSPADIGIDPADADQAITRLELPGLDLKLGLEIMGLTKGGVDTEEGLITSDIVLDCRPPDEHLGSTLVTFGFSHQIDWNLNTAVTTGAALTSDPAFRICKSRCRQADNETEMAPTICALPDNLVLIGHSESAVQRLGTILDMSKVQAIGTKTCPHVSVYDQPYIRAEIDGVWRVFADSGSELTLAFGVADETADLLL
jgi:hypothetical protein